MAVSSRGRSAELLQASRKWKDRDVTPERTRVWTTEPNRNHHPAVAAAIAGGSAVAVVERKVPVVYYLCRNGQLEHPHFMEVPLSFHDGLYLRDVINRLNQLRGKGMASLYSWSSKRSYKNGFVWHDLSENDFIYPAHGHEYVLKGSELLQPPKPFLLESTPSSRSMRLPVGVESHAKSSSSGGDDSDFPAITRRRNQSWSSIDLNEYKVYKAESFSESTRTMAADASTQTDDRRRRRAAKKKEEGEIEELHGGKGKEPEAVAASSSREEIEISPPPSDSSPETLESLMKADGRLLLTSTGNEDAGLNRTAGESFGGGRVKASSVLMQLISCGSISFRDCGATAVKEQGLSLIGQYKGRLPRGVGGGSSKAAAAAAVKEIPAFSGVRLEDKEYFSGSLVETKKEEIPTLKRSNSYNADRSSQLQQEEKETEGVRTKCIPMKTKGMPAKKGSNITVHGDDNISSSSRVCSKRFESQQVENEAK